MVITLTEYPRVSAAQDRSKSTRPIHCFPVETGKKWNRKNKNKKFKLMLKHNKVLLCFKILSMQITVVPAHD